jgi:hypothetical protein
VRFSAVSMPPYYSRIETSSLKTINLTDKRLDSIPFLESATIPRC